MPTLPNVERESLFGLFARELSGTRTPTGLVKDDVRAAINAIDAWVELNAGAFNAAIPQPARGALSAAQKARLLWCVVQRRFEVG